MESVFGRYRNLIVLVGVLFAQVLGLAVQVRRTTDSEPTRLIRIWAVGSVTPLEKVLNWARNSTGNIWHNYFYLRGVRSENRELKQEIERLHLAQARITQDADQARRLQALLGFKEQFISQTMAAQVIGSSGSELSRSVYIDKGWRDGIRPDMAVITKDGIVGKVLRAYGAQALEPSTSLVLLIDDQTSGVGCVLDKTRLQGILRGTSTGEVVLEKVMSDEAVPVGEQVLTSGGDGIFPKGLPVGTVTKVSAGSELFLNIRVRPAADLSRLEEVLVVTKVDERQAQPDQATTMRAVDILAGRLPTVPPKGDAAADSAGKDSAARAGGTSTAPVSPAVHSTVEPKTKSAFEMKAPDVAPGVGAVNTNTGAARVGAPAPGASVGKQTAPASPAGTATPGAPGVPKTVAPKPVSGTSGPIVKPKSPPTAQDTPQ